MIRHTKQGSLGGAPVLSLPPVTESQVPVAFGAEERAAYDLARQAAVAQFNDFKALGAGAVQAKLLAVLALLYVLLALGLNIVVGFAGLLDLGFVAFYALASSAIAPTLASAPHGRHCDEMESQRKSHALPLPAVQRPKISST